jgi:hypothetical protein
VDQGKGPEFKPQYNKEKKIPYTQSWTLSPIILFRRQRSGGSQFEDRLGKKFITPSQPIKKGWLWWWDMPVIPAMPEA